MAKDPAFLFYHHDFLIGTEFMSAEETGLYIRILCHLADKGRLSLEHMQSICKGYAFSTNLKNKFLQDSDGLFYNERLRKEVEKRQLYSESRRKNAKAYAEHMGNRNENRDIDSKGIVKGDFIETLKANIAYKHINIEIELAKMDAWLALPRNKGRKKTDRFILNWLNKIDKPINTKSEARPQTRKDHIKERPHDPAVAAMIHQTAKAMK